MSPSNTEPEHQCQIKLGAIFSYGEEILHMSPVPAYRKVGNLTCSNSKVETQRKVSGGGLILLTSSTLLWDNWCPSGLKICHEYLYLGQWEKALNRDVLRRRQRSILVKLRCIDYPSSPTRLSYLQALACLVNNLFGQIRNWESNNKNSRSHPSSQRECTAAACQLTTCLVPVRLPSSTQADLA